MTAFPARRVAVLMVTRQEKLTAMLTESPPVVVRVDGPVRQAVQKRRARNRKKVQQASAINPCKTDLKATAGVHSKGITCDATSILWRFTEDEAVVSFSPRFSEVMSGVNQFSEPFQRLMDETVETVHVESRLNHRTEVRCE